MLGFIDRADDNLSNDGHRRFLGPNDSNANRRKRRKRSSAPFLRYLRFLLFNHPFLCSCHARNGAGYIPDTTKGVRRPYSLDSNGALIEVGSGNSTPFESQCTRSRGPGLFPLAIRADSPPYPNGSGASPYWRAVFHKRNGYLASASWRGRRALTNCDYSDRLLHPAAVTPERDGGSLQSSVSPHARSARPLSPIPG